MVKLLIVVAAIVGVLVMIVGYRPMDDPRYLEQAAHDAKVERVNTMCAEMLHDNAPGAERRMTRDICNKLKAQIAAERK